MDSTLENSMKAAAKAVDDAKETAGQTVHRAHSTILGGLRVAASTIVALRGLGLGAALGWMGLQRRRSSTTILVTLGAGFLAGAAAGILFAPVSGAEMRRSLAERAAEARKQKDAVAREVEGTGAKGSDAVHKGHEAANGEPNERRLD